MSKINAVLGEVPTAREPDAHHGARDALTPLGLAKFRAYFRTQPPLAEGIDVDTEVPGISAGYDLRVGQANELEPMLRSALPLTKPSLDGPDRATLARAFGGLGKSGPYALGEDDKGPVAPAIAALKALKAKQAKEAEGAGGGEVRELVRVHQVQPEIHPDVLEKRRQSLRGERRAPRARLAFAQTRIYVSIRDDGNGPSGRRVSS